MVPEPAAFTNALILLVNEVPDIKEGKVHWYVVFATAVTE